MITSAFSLLLLMFAQAPPPQAPAGGLAEFVEADNQVRRFTLNQLAAHKIQMPPSVLADVIRAGLSDRDQSVRALAAYAAAGRAAALRFGDASQKELGASERPALISLRPLLLRLLDRDDDSRVRQASIIALVNLEYEGGPSHNRILLRDDFAAAMAKRFTVEEDSGVRIEIAKTFALTSAESVGRHNVLMEALSSQDSRLLEYAVLGLARSRPPEALGKIVPLMKRPEKNVRLQAVQAVAAFGPAARQFIPEVEQALAAEKDEVVRRTLEATLELLRQARAKQTFVLSPPRK